MKTTVLTIGLLLSTILTVFSQTATIQGNVQTNAAGDQSGIEVSIEGNTLNGINNVIIDQVVYTDAAGNYSFTYNLYANPLYPVLPNQYADILVTITFHKNGFDDKEILNVSANTTPVTLENTLLFPTGIVLYKPEIAMVLYDTLGHYPNVVWKRDEGENIKTYVIYKLVGSAWEKAGEVPFEEHGVFEDIVNDASQQYEYQLQVIFEDDSKSDYSASKQSPKIEVSVENGVPKIRWANLNEVSRIDPLLVRKVILYRSESAQGVFEPVDELVITGLTEDQLISKLTMLDQTIPEEGTYYYRIGHEYYTWIDPRNLLKIESGPFILAMSNISEAQNAETIISKITDNSQVAIAVQGTRVEISTNTNLDYTISTADGKIVSQGVVNGTQTVTLPQGVFVVRCGSVSKTISIN